MDIRLRVLLTPLLLLILCTALLLRPSNHRSHDSGVIGFSTQLPHLHVIAGRVIAEPDPGLTDPERRALWSAYGVEPTLEWVRSGSAADAGFAYCELRVRDWTWRERTTQVTRTFAATLGLRPPPGPLPSRNLPELIAQLTDDPRIHWAAPDALILAWAEPPKDVPQDEAPTGDFDQIPLGEPSDDAGGGRQDWEAAQAQAAGGGVSADAEAYRLETDGGYVAALVNEQYKAVFAVRDWEAALARVEAAQSGKVTGATADRPDSTPDLVPRPDGATEEETDGAPSNVEEDEDQNDEGRDETDREEDDESKAPPVLPGPFPEFEYYRLAPPTGAEVQWAPELAASRAFMQRCARVYGMGQAQALAGYQAEGSPPLAPITVCVADTGVDLNHPDLLPRLHPNAIDANYTSLRIAPAGKRPGPALELTDREDEAATGLPRLAIRGRPAGHGTSCAGLVTRCTAGFLSASQNLDGQRVPAVRLLPASLKSDRTVTWVGGRVKTPISAFIRLVYTLNKQFPTGQVVPPLDAEVVNTGDVRVVTVSASVPKSYFSDAEWRIVANLAGKAAGAVAEDLRSNDRLYVFAAGNEAQGEPNKPGGEDYVLAVSAAQAFDGGQAWVLPQFDEGSNMGPDCVSAPGEGLITSSIYRAPNLAYLPDNEFHSATNWSTPRTNQDWVQRSNTFGATSGATPQVAALAALLYAQDRERRYGDVLALIRESCAGRTLSAPYGTSRGLVDYRAALGWRSE